MRRKSKYRTNKTIKKNYTKSKRFDKSCRNHGGCGWCEDNRLYQYNRAKEAAKIDLDDWCVGWDMLEGMTISEISELGI